MGSDSIDPERSDVFASEAKRSNFVKKCDVIARRAKPDAATPRWTSQAIKRLLRRCAPRNDIAFVDFAAPSSQ